MRKGATMNVGWIIEDINLAIVRAMSRGTQTLPQGTWFWDLVGSVRELAKRYGWRTRLDRRKWYLWFYGPTGRRFYIALPPEGEYRVPLSTLGDLRLVVQTIVEES